MHRPNIKNLLTKLSLILSGKTAKTIRRQTLLSFEFLLTVVGEKTTLDTSFARLNSNRF